MIPEAVNHLYDLGSGLSRPQVFECSDGIDRVVKMRRLSTYEGMASDWVGGLLAVELGVAAPFPSLLTVTASAIETMPPALAIEAEPGIAYSNTYFSAASTITGLDSILACGNHRQLLSRLVALDTWIQTEDRMTPEFGRNLLIDTDEPSPELLAIDFGLCFSEALMTLFGHRRELRRIVCRAEIKPLLDIAEIREAVNRIESTSDAVIVKMVHTIPDGWLGDEGKGKLVSYLLDARTGVRSLIEQGLGVKL
ncbi:MAG: hypothetical protein IT303_10070 [Dehalococcoidia bacterium]|nr:hypothetical protein [Dehalococcoidia bacterium]